MIDVRQSGVVSSDVKLSYVFSAYYASQGYDSQACE